MAGLTNLKKRLEYRGGNAEDRMIKDKLRSLRKALLYSYQADTIELLDGRQFRCLINKVKLSEDYYDNVISIPYKDICLNRGKVGTTPEGLEEVGLKPGDVFTWLGKEVEGVKPPDTKWLVYLQHLQEKAYFRAEIRQCTTEVEIDGIKYPVYLKGPDETEFRWNLRHNISWNDLNYKLIMYIPRTDAVIDYFYRFKKIEIDGNMWEVAVVNRYSADGILKVCLNETFNNEMEKVQIPVEPDIPAIEQGSPRFIGPTLVSPYDVINYSVENVSGGNWIVSNNKAKILQSTDTTATVEVVTGRSGDFNLIYRKDNEDIITLPIVIKSL